MNAPVPPLGVEEELLLVDPGTGTPRGLAGGVRAEAAELDGEMRSEQVETASDPHWTADRLAADLRRRRTVANDAARARGVEVAAVATSPVAPEASEESLVPSGRYGDIAERFGPIASVQLTNGQHVHVEVDSPEEGIGALDRIGPWLPLLRALSANSPYWRGRDTGYASYRTVVWSRWPTAGPTRVFGSPQAYEQTVEAMLATGTVLDEAMVYFDARFVRRLSTVEVRVADVATEVEDAVLLAVLARALVTTGAAAWRHDEPPTTTPVEALQLAHWGAARWGLSGDLVHPRTGHPVPAAEAVDALREHVDNALAETGDVERAAKGCARLLADGTGAECQRAAARAAGGDLAAVVADLVDRTRL